ncbi:MAG: hypothetical protein KY476_05335 [Planctomycetes bacterium]|nr:hypothetical protein [Planctomycetota bacterium]
MTGYTVHTGSNDKFREGWDRIFQGGGAAGKRKAAGKSAAGAKARKSAKAKKGGSQRKKSGRSK